MEPVVIFGVWAGVVTLSIVGNVLYTRHQRQRFSAAFQADPEYELVDAETCLLRSKGAGHRTPLTATLRPTSVGSGKSKVILWEIEVDGVSLGHRTSLTLSLEGLLGALREAVGRQDVHIGDEAFDKRFTIRGSAPDAIQAAFRHHDVKKAASALFDGLRLRTEVSLDSAGRLTAQAYRRGMSPDDARNALKLMRGLAEALHRAGERGR